MDEEALLKQFAAQFAHGPDDADDTDAAAAAQGADSTANQVADDADQSPATFDTQQFQMCIRDSTPGLRFAGTPVT